MAVEERRQLKSAVSSQKSWWTRCVKDIEGACLRFKAKPNDLAAATLQTFSSKADERYLVIQQAISDLNEVYEDDDAVAELEIYANSVQDQYDKIKNGVSELLNKYNDKTTNPKAQTPEASGYYGQLRVVLDL